MAIDDNGKFLALHLNVLANMGAFLSTAGAFIATNNFARCLSTVYAIPRVSVRVRCVFTNSLPTGPYRGAGRPEANYAMERLVEAASKVVGIDSVALRRRNMITPKMLPYKTPVGTSIDSGDFEKVLDRALALSNFADFPTRRMVATKHGKRPGIGVSCFLEHSGGTPRESAARSFPTIRRFCWFSVFKQVVKDMRLYLEISGRTTGYSRRSSDCGSVSDSWRCLRWHQHSVAVDDGGRHHGY